SGPGSGIPSGCARACFAISTRTANGRRHATNATKTARHQNGYPPMASIAEPIAKPVSRFRFLLDRRDVLGALFVTPAILYVLLLVGLPFLLAVYYSVSAYTIYDPTWRFVGLRNFEQIVQDPVFLETLWNTFLFTFGSQFLGLVLGKFGALLLLRPFPGRRLVRALIILPWAVPIALAAVAWQWMFDSLYSVINW